MQADSGSTRTRDRGRPKIRFRPIRFRTAFILLSGFALFLLDCHSPKQTTLVGLQQEMLRARSENERQSILVRLDRYYLNLVVPDSIRRHVQDAVEARIHDTDSSRFNLHLIQAEPNVYARENRFRGLVRELMIARCRGDETGAQTLIASAIPLAESIDTETRKEYWRPALARLAGLDPDQARIWLSADQAERLCTRYNRTAYLVSEYHGALGLQFLEKIGDDRIRQDIYQRLLTIIYQDRGLYDLSYPCFQREIENTERIRYTLRTTGFLFHYATALLFGGQNIQASEIFQITIQKAEEFRLIPEMDWYQKSAYLGIARTKRRFGDYQSALSICNMIEKSHIDVGQLISIYTTRGITYLYLGDFDRAESEYNKTLNLAILHSDIPNQIIALRNIGLLYFRLTEHEKAIHYFENAMQILETHSPDNIVQQCRLLLNLAETRAEQGVTEKSEDLIEKAEELIRLLDLPTVQGEMLQSVGRLNLKLGRYAAAHQRFREAVGLYEKNGLLRESLEVKNEMISSLMRLSELQKAKELLKETLKVAEEIDDAGHRIDAIGMMAEIARKEGKIEEAVHKSNQMIRAIETVSARFSNPDNLIFYRQKIHTHLHNAVRYEIELGRVDSALIKLDYLKSRAAKNMLLNPKEWTPNPFSWFLNLDSVRTRLDRKRSLVSYFLTEDTLYAFVITPGDVCLLRHPVRQDELEREVHALLEDIQKSPGLFQTHRPTVWDANYRSITQRSRRLYTILFGWPALQARLRQTDVMYIVPDGILHTLPFHCLMENTETHPRFLIEQTAVVHLPSAIFLQSPRKMPAGKEADAYRVLISADRNFPGADRFIESIKTRFPLAEELVVPGAVHTKEKVLSALNRKYHLMILLGHSTADTVRPDSSRFDLAVLNPSGMKQSTVRLTLADLKRIDWTDTEIVCLIGCETGMGKLYQGSGLTGFSQSMLTLGAKQVLASYWQIDARTAIDQMTEFFRNSPLENGSARALQQVQVHMIRDLSRDSYYREPHPYLWAGFFLTQSMHSE